MVATVLRVLFENEEIPPVAESTSGSNAEATDRQTAELLKLLSACGF